jgi:hypothetical protein
MVHNMVNYNPHGKLTLYKGTPMDRGANCALLEIGNHASKQIRGDERDLT